MALLHEDNFVAEAKLQAVRGKFICIFISQLIIFSVISLVPFY